MKFSLLILSACVLLIGPANYTYSHEAHSTKDAEEDPTRFGPDKAITAVDRHEGMKFSEKSVKRLGLKFQPVKIGSKLQVPTQALVYTQEEVGVYRLHDGWLQLVDVEVTSKRGAEAEIQSHHLEANDQIVVQGAALIRVAELDVWGSGGGEHEH